MKNLVILLSCLILFSNGLFGQLNDSIPLDSIEEVQPKYNRLRFALNYSSANTFFGNKDSVNIPILTPSVKFTLYNNLFARASLVHSNTTKLLFDELNVQLGYRFFYGDNFDASVSYTRYFYDSKVGRINSVIQNDLNAYAVYDFGFLYTGLSFDYTFGSTSQTKKAKANKKGQLKNGTSLTLSSNDYTFTWMNSQQFYWYEVFHSLDKFILTPEIDIYYGTQNGLQVYGDKKLETQNTSSGVGLKSIAFNLDAMYVIDNRLTLNISPYYTVPYDVTSGERLEPFFVMYGGIYYTLKWEK